MLVVLPIMFSLQYQYYIMYTLYISYFRILLYTLSNSIEEKEFRRIRSYLSGVTKIPKISNCKNLRDVFYILEMSMNISKTKVDLLVEVMKLIKQADVIEKVNEYKRNLPQGE